MRLYSMLLGKCLRGAALQVIKASEQLGTLQNSPCNILAELMLNFGLNNIVEQTKNDYINYKQQDNTLEVYLSGKYLRGQRYIYSILIYNMLTINDRDRAQLPSASWMLSIYTAGLKYKNAAEIYKLDKSNLTNNINKYRAALRKAHRRRIELARYSKMFKVKDVNSLF